MGDQGVRRAVLVLPGPTPAAVFNQRLSRKLNSVGTLGWSGLALQVVFPFAGGKTRQAVSQGPPVFQMSAFQASVVRWCPTSQWSHAAKPKVNGGRGVDFTRAWTPAGRAPWGPLTWQDPKAWFHFLEFTSSFLPWAVSFPPLVIQQIFRYARVPDKGALRKFTF